MRKSVATIAFLLATGTSHLVADEDQSLKNYKPSLSPEFLALLSNADIEAGAAYFDRKCSSCHDAQEGGIHQKGPLLWNWFGRKAGSINEFKYSEAMRSSGHTWTYETLNYYLTKTERAVPGRIMNFRGIRSDKTRANLLAYLRQFNKPVPELP